MTHQNAKPLNGPTDVAQTPLFTVTRDSMPNRTRRIAIETCDRKKVDYLLARFEQEGLAPKVFVAYVDLLKAQHNQW